MRCRRLPPVDAILRSCCEAPARIALAIGIALLDQRMIGEVGIGHERTDAYAAVGVSSTLLAAAAKCRSAAWGARHLLHQIN